jgi:hypothetical protein
LSTPRSPSFALHKLYEPSWTLLLLRNPWQLCEFPRDFLVVPYVLGSCSFLTPPERNLNDLAPLSFYGAFLGHPETDLCFGCVLIRDDGLVQDFVDFFDPQGIGLAYRSPSFDCYFLPSIVFLLRLMALGSSFKIVFEQSRAIL